MILCHRRIRAVLNVLILLVNIITKNDHWQKDHKLLKRFLYKLILVDVCAITVIFCSYFPFEHTGYPHLAFLNFTSMWSLAVFCNGFLAVCYTVAHLYRLINLRVDECMEKLSDFEKQQSYWAAHPGKKKLICYQVAADLDKLAYLHQDVTTVMKTIVKTLDYSLLLAILWCFLITMAGIFYTYTSLVQDIRDNVTPPFTKYCHSFGLSIFQALQFYYIVSGSTLLTRRAEKTGVVVNRFFRTDIDERTERTIDMFSMGLLHRSYSVENFGMFKVDFTLMYSMVGTITSYLIIMIQFQLSEL
ncbi:putative gustatory receptor 28b [Sabethes cyaneus]|uniref:putative gustatory receptor 28b n=1 Tax=Sabethes cyaneus TaxID=53552 RepID=UPI00237E3BB7|nr:putative gustatory receptor 28b [Sabethes cyaneus]